MSIGKQFAKYVSRNILAMLGVSGYILADTFFISIAAGVDGITILNMALPIYGLIYALGAMIGVGSATRYAILRARGQDEADSYLFNGLFFICLVSLPFVYMGIFSPDTVVFLMGGRGEIVSQGSGYFRFMLGFAPAFMINHLVQAFVRNDNDPTRAMVSTLISNAFNIVFDYILMFPLGMGFVGAAIATAVSPIVGVAICSTHFLKKNNTLRFTMTRPSLRKLYESCQLGISAFVAEISSAVTTAVYNYLLLGLVGNIGVAAYGVIANLALVVVAVFNGTAQGMQPLVSRYYGEGRKSEVRKLLKYGVVTAWTLSFVFIVIAFVRASALVNIFNSEGSAEMARLATEGMRIYFIGYIFAGFNIVVTGFFGATARAKEAFVASALRGFVAIIVSAVLLAHFFGVNGVWMSFGFAELITTGVIVFFIRNENNR